MQTAVDRVLAGDTDAFSEIVTACGPAVHAVIAAQLYDHSAVEDVVQETFITAFQQLADYDAERDLSRWLKGIARNKVLMYLRTERRRTDRIARAKERIQRAVEEQLACASADDGLEEIERLRQCLGSLAERTRTIIEQRYLGQQAVKDIAKRLKSSVTAISNVLFRGRKQLETCMQGRSS